MPTIQTAAMGPHPAFAASLPFCDRSDRSPLPPTNVRNLTPQQYEISQHAALRMAQRGIPSRVVSALIATGKREHDGRGGVRIHLRHRAARRRFASVLDPEAAARYRDVYAVVVGEGLSTPAVLVTVGRLRANTKASGIFSTLRRSLARLSITRRH